ncbi:hypothetical protein EGK75_01260 [Neisseria weixii]|uniref:BRCT domain-containing protein n=1 Tax=Neisseria weixii TaxID=1853276 RepID=A0A3N4NAD6_9NEIS|nr:exonuclease domain-containing protein [Neisseria weixii]RPD90486.1 hypothetical protein EGK74_01685 [Neisseria weixii]RPD90572.1 hypothetical protein EGK75_01260 [Neisseria weixii]
MNTHPIAKQLALLAENGVFLDTETTGLDENAEIIEIAVIDMQGNTLLNTTVKPKTAYDNNDPAYLVHGIPYAELQNSPTWPQVQEMLLDVIKGRPILIYNAPFDVRMMNQTAYLNGYYEVEYNTVCLMKLFSEWHTASTGQERKRHRLSYAAEHCGVTVNNAHRALADCLTTLGVFKYMLKNSENLFDLSSYKTRNKRITVTANESGRLFGQTVVITGDLSLPRAELQQIAADAGCNCTSSVSKNTTILVLGETNLSAVKDGMSSKERKARELQAAGYPIRILSESEFMALLEDE